MATPATHPPHFIANNLALDFINSAFGVGQARHDCLADDASVAAWLKAAGQWPAGLARPPAGLAELARALREAAGRMVQAAQAGQAGDPGLVNQVLEAGRPAKRLAWDDGQGGYALAECPRDHSAASLLEPVAAALADLLAGDALRHVRRCEAHDCTLVFLDVTKSHRRRWCSMALCGNRMKVAAFRSRRQGAG